MAIFHSYVKLPEDKWIKHPQPPAHRGPQTSMHCTIWISTPWPAPSRPTTRRTTPAGETGRPTWMFRALKAAPKSPQRRPTMMQKIKVLSTERSEKIWKDLKRSEKIWVIVWGFGRNQRFWTWFVQGCLVNISMESWKCPANKGCRYNLDQLAPAPANSADMVRCFDNGCLVLQNRSSTTS